MTDNVTDLPDARFPEPLGADYTDVLEVIIVQRLVEAIEFEQSNSLHHACGLAQARQLYLVAATGVAPLWGTYIATVSIAIRRLSDRQRAKLRHPAITRAAVQHILDGDSR